MTNRVVRVLLVDDSVYMLMALRSMLGSQNMIEIVGEARNGAQAVTMAKTLKPDVITMDVHMPVMDGVEATRQINQEMAIPIIMLSSITEDGADATFHALEAGAVDYIPKSSSALEVDLGTVATDIIEKICFWGTRGLWTRPEESLSPAYQPAKTAIDVWSHFKEKAPSVCDLLVLMAGNGGPKILGEMLAALQPENFNLPILVAQQMPAAFTSGFIAYLRRVSKIPVCEIGHHATLKAGAINVLPGGRDAQLVQRANDPRPLTVSLQRGQNAQNHPSSDLLLQNLAQNTLSSLIVVLTGRERLYKGPMVLSGKDHFLVTQSLESCISDQTVQDCHQTGLESFSLSPLELIDWMYAWPKTNFQKAA